MIKKIVLGAGCFWGVQAAFELINGVEKTRVGYSGGDKSTANYDAVCSKSTGHYEVLEIQFDSNLLSINEILGLFFFIHDPTQADGQGNDIGPQYLSAIITYASDDQNSVNDYLQKLQASTSEKIITSTLHNLEFFAAEEYHQNYLAKNPGGYCHINMVRVKEFLENHKYRLK